MLPYDMFDATRTTAEARRAQKLESIYHRGQELAWNGREVLGALIAKHGGVHVPEGKREALSRIFSILMWGELAAWKISAQLADALVPLEAKMAATSQAFDEARHFYVFHDYLCALGPVPPAPDRHSQAAIALVLGTRSLAEKLLGMQLLLEPMALTIFHIVRHLGVEPVLSELLEYYERDEARHVGLGVQELPELLRAMRPDERARLLLFQLRILTHVLMSLKANDPALRALGVSAREVLDLGTAKQDHAARLLFTELGIEPTLGGEILRRTLGAACAVAFPNGDEGFSTRMKRAVEILRHGLTVASVPLTEVQ
jgi:hypothetical protein